MTITQRTAEVRRRLDEIQATHDRFPGDQRREHLIRRCFAEAAALSGEIGKLEAYVASGMEWWEKHKHKQGTSSVDKMVDRIWDAIVAREDARETLRDALRVLTPIEGVEMPTLVDGPVFGAEVAA